MLRSLLLLCPLLLLFSCQEKDPWAHDSSLPQKISFNQHIRPLLARECIQCHGPESAQGNLRLDRPSGVSSVTSENSPKKSLLWEKILASHPVPLPERDQALLWRWIKQGTPSEEHWAALPLASPAPSSLPQPLSLDDTVSVAEFSFLARTLLGREPLPEEVALLEKSQPKRSQVIDGLMMSESFARAFRTRLLLLTGTKPMPKGTPFSPYFRWLENEIAEPDFSVRDFLTNSLAGDLPPQAGQQGTIATAWLRLPNQSGIDSLAERVADRLLGLDLTRPSNANDLWPRAAQTLPLFLPEFPNASSGRIANPPFLPVQTPEQRTALASAMTKEAERWEASGRTPEGAAEGFAAWLSDEARTAIVPDLAASYSFEQELPIDGAPNPSSAVKLGVNGLTKGVQGFALAAPADFQHLPLGSNRAFTLSFFLRVPTLPQADTPLLSSLTPEGAQVGFRFSLSQEGISIGLLNGSVANSLSTTTKVLPTPGHWHHFTITYDGSRSARGIALWIDAKEAPLETTNGHLYGIAEADGRELLFRFPQPEGSAPAALDELQVHHAVLSEMEIPNLRDGKALLAAVRDEFPREDLLFRYFLRSRSEAKRSAIREAVAASSKVGMLQDSAFLVPVAERTPPPAQRPTLPFLPLPHTSNPDRLGLAQWLCDDRNPVTPRVVVSRLYQMVYGVGLLPAGQDLSDPWQVPQDQALLDFLARDLIAKNWSLREILRTIILYPPPTEAA